MTLFEEPFADETKLIRDWVPCPENWNGAVVQVVLRSEFNGAFAGEPVD